MHEAEDEKHDADSRHGLLEHVGDGARSSAGVDQDRRGAEVDQVEADDEEPVHRIREAILFEHGDEERPAVAMQRVADPDGQEHAGRDVDEVVDQSQVSQVHVYHPSSKSGFEHVQL